MKLEKLVKENISSIQQDFKENYPGSIASVIPLDRAFRRVIPKYSEGKLLDVGAGKMLYKNPLQDNCTSYESLDISDYEGIDYVQDIQDMDIEDRTYDTIFCSNVLEHVESPRSAVDEMARILKTDGKVIVAVPFLFYLHNEPEDYYRFTDYGLEEMFEDSGFKKKELVRAGGLFSFLASLTSIIMLYPIYHVPVLSTTMLYLNYAFQNLCLLADRITHSPRILPFHYVAVFEKK